MCIKFDPNNDVIKLCMSGMNLEGSGNIEDATTMFHKAWHESTDDCRPWSWQASKAAFAVLYSITSTAKPTTKKGEFRQKSSKWCRYVPKNRKTVFPHTAKVLKNG